MLSNVTINRWERENIMIGHTFLWKCNIIGHGVENDNAVWIIIMKFVQLMYLYGFVLVFDVIYLYLVQHLLMNKSLANNCMLICIVDNIFFTWICIYLKQMGSVAHQIQLLEVQEPVGGGRVLYYWIGDPFDPRVKTEHCRRVNYEGGYEGGSTIDTFAHQGRCR